MSLTNKSGLALSYHTPFVLLCMTRRPCRLQPCLWGESAWESLFYLILKVRIHRFYSGTFTGTNAFPLASTGADTGNGSVRCKFVHQVSPRLEASMPLRVIKHRQRDRVTLENGLY